MKKLLFLALVVSALLSGCTSTDGPTLPTAEGEEYSEFRTEKELLAIAEDAPGLFDEVQARTSRKVTSGLIPVANTNARSESEIEIYAINFEDEQGFVLVTDNRAIDGLLAYVPEGSYSNELLDIPAFADLISRPTIPTDSIAKPVPYPGIPNPNPGDGDDDDDDGTMKKRITETKTTKTTLENYPRKVSTKWGQGIPANLFFSNFSAGCGPVAAGQAMSYIQPPYITLSFPGKDTDKVTFDWSEIRKHIRDHDSYVYDCNASESVHKQIAYLCREIAHRANAQYIPFATGTTPNGIYNALTSLFSSYCNISTPIVFSSASELENRLKNDVCIMFAADAYGNYSNHAFLIDGYKIVKRYDVCRWRYDDDSIRQIWHILWETETITTYYHVNWGWSNDGNGYFSSDLLNPSRPYELDNSNFSSDMSANYNKDKIFISIHKKD